MATKWKLRAGEMGFLSRITGGYGARVWLGALLSGMAMAPTCLGDVGKKPAATLIYELKDGLVDDSLPRLASAINARLGDQGKARVVNDRRIAVDIYDDDQRAVNYIKLRLAGPGVLEFRITASRNFEKHKMAIDLAEKLPADRNVVRHDGRKIAKWVDYDEREFGDADQAAKRGLIARSTGKGLQALVMTDDRLDLTGEYIRSASPDVDEFGRPQVTIHFNAGGAFLISQLTKQHLPNRAGERYGLGILLGDRLITAPSIETRIEDRARISGGSMSDAEVEFIVGILNAGSLPSPLRLVDESATLKKIAE